jgi:agmatine deiminase
MKHSLRVVMSLFMIVTLSANVLSQSNPLQQLQAPLTHQINADELSRLSEIGLTFIETDPPVGTVSSIAEFDRASGALIAYPFGIPLSLIREMSYDAIVTTLVPNATAEQEVRSQYMAARVNMENCQFMHILTNSYWTRDFGPMFITYGTNQIGIVDFPYNRPRPYDDDAPRLIAQQLGISWFGMNVIHTGGNYMTDGYGFASSTTIAYTENPNLTPTEVDARMEAYLGIDDYSVLEDPNNTYIDHIDCWGKYLAPDKILIRSVPQNHPQYNAIEATADYYENKISIYGTTYRVYRVNTPQNQPYTNSYILNDKVFVPIVGSQYDDDALQAYREAMPGYKVFGIEERPETGWQSTDALHCRAHEMADLGMLHIKHIPLIGNVSAAGSYAFTANVTPYSGQNVIEDSVILHYRVNSNLYTPYTSVTMSHTSGTYFTATIESPPAGSKIEYFISAADQSGRKENHPFMGPSDPHIFFIGSQMEADASVSPTTVTFTAMKDTEDTKTLTINNTGQAPLNYTLKLTTDVNDTLAFSLINSPSPTSWDANTLSESNWTTFSVTGEELVGNIVISYHWNTDDFYREGSFWIESPSGTQFEVATAQLDGIYKIVCPVFTGESMSGNWKVWLTDSYGDGGHQATNVSVKIVKDNSMGTWISASETTGIITASSSAEVQLTADAQNLDLGTYEGRITLWSNDLSEPEIIIPVSFTVTINTAIESIGSISEEISVNPNPFNDHLLVKFNLLEESSFKIELYNSNGTRVYDNSQKAPIGTSSLSISSSALSKGIYLLRITNSGEVTTYKLIK